MREQVSQLKRLKALISEWSALTSGSDEDPG